MEKTEFCYADQGRQIQKVNLFMCIATAILNVLTYTVIVVSFLLKNQTLAYTICTFLAMAGTTIGGFVMIARNRKSNKVRYFMMIGLFVITAMLIYGFSDYYMRFLAAMPFIGCVLFFDTRFFRIASIVISVENIGMTLLREFVLKNYGEEEFLANIVAALAASVMMFVLWYVTKVGKEFNSDSLGQVQANAQTQKVMLDDVMLIAESAFSKDRMAIYIFCKIFFVAQRFLSLSNPLIRDVCFLLMRKALLNNVLEAFNIF